MIRFKHVSQQYPNGHRALSQVNFFIESGECVFITGHSGAGKSTVLKLIAGLEPATRGQVTVDNIDIKQLQKWQVPYYRRQIGLILQDPMLLTSKTCFDNVALPLKILHTEDSVVQKRVRAALDKVGLLSKANCFPDTLSTGEQQRLSIARAVVHRPKIILADEPTGNLDPALSLEIFNLFERFQQVGVTLLIATHDVMLLKSFNHRQLVLSQGELIRDEAIISTQKAI